MIKLRSKRSSLVTIVALTAGLATLAASAQAGTTKRWERLTAEDDGATYQVGLARTADGVLHVAWQRNETGSKGSLHHTSIAASGRFGPTTTIVPNWEFISYPDLVLTPDGGLRAFFGGIETTSPSETNTQMNTATAPASGAPWSVQTSNVNRPGTSGTEGAGAAAAFDGTPFVSWAPTVGLFVHRGTSSATPDHQYRPPPTTGCCDYNPDLAVDGATGQMMIAWFSNATGREGVWAREVNTATGAPAGTPVRMPGPSTSQMVARTPVAGRPGKAGVYVAYPVGNRVLLWRVGSSRSRRITRRNGTFHDIAGVTGDPNGRLWVFWSEKRGARYRIVARRSNPRATRFGERVSLRPPRGSVDDFHLQGDAQANRLDLFAGFGRVDGTSTWHRQVLPGLTLRARARRTRTGEVVVRTRITDAGAPVQDATVKARGQSAETNARGRVKLELGSVARRFLSVRASKASYTRDLARVRIRGRRP